MGTRSDTGLELIPRRTALRTMGMSVRTGDRREKTDPDFPPRIAIGPGRWAYRKADCLRWIESRATAPRAGVTPSQAAQPARDATSLEVAVFGEFVVMRRADAERLLELHQELQRAGYGG